MHSTGRRDGALGSFGNDRVSRPSGQSPSTSSDSQGENVVGIVAGYARDYGKYSPLSYSKNDYNECISIQETIDGFSASVAVLECKPTADWNDRAHAISQLADIAERGGIEHDVFFSLLLQSKEALLSQILDLRSTLVKCATNAIGSIAELVQRRYVGEIPHAWIEIASCCIEACLRQVPVTIKIISESANQCIQRLLLCLAPNGSAKVLLGILTHKTDKSSQVRRVCLECADFTLTSWPEFWRSGISAKSLIEIREVLNRALVDPTNQVRQVGRRCYWSLSNCFPESAADIMNKLDESSRRRLIEACSTKETHSKNDRGEKVKAIQARPIETADRFALGVAKEKEGQSLENNQALTDSTASSKSSEPSSNGPSSRPLRVVQDETFASNIHNVEQVSKNYSQARRVAGVQRAPNQAAPSRTATSLTNVSGASRPLNRGAVRVIPSVLIGASRVHGATRTVTQKKEGSKDTCRSAKPSARVPVGLEKLLHNLENSHDWLCRLEAITEIRKRYPRNVNGLSCNTTAKLCKVLCERVSDPHSKVIVEVLGCVVALLSELPREFGEHLKDLISAVLIGCKSQRRAQSDYSMEILKQCQELYSADHLCLVLCDICKKKGDTLRLSCLEYLLENLPSTRNFLYSASHISQLLTSLEPCLLSRKNELRRASSEIILAVDEYDHSLVESIVTSGDIDLSLAGRIRKLVSRHRAALSHSELSRSSLVEPISDSNVERYEKSVDKSSEAQAKDVNKRVISCMVGTKEQFNSRDDIHSANGAINTANQKNAMEEANFPKEEVIVLLASLSDSRNGKDKMLDSIDRINDILMDPASAYILNSFIPKILTACVDELCTRYGMVQEKLLLTISTIVQEHGKHVNGVLEYVCKRLLISSGIKSFQALEALDGAMTNIFEYCDASECLRVLYSGLTTIQQPTVVQQALRYFPPVLSRLEGEEIFKWLPTIVPPLSRMLNDSNPTTRRYATICFVELTILSGNPLVPYFRNLTIQQQKLVQLYVEKYHKVRGEVS